MRRLLCIKNTVSQVYYMDENVLMCSIVCSTTTRKFFRHNLWALSKNQHFGFFKFIDEGKIKLAIGPYTKRKH